VLGLFVLYLLGCSVWELSDLGFEEGGELRGEFFFFGGLFWSGD